MSTGILPVREAVKISKFLRDILECSPGRLSSKFKTGKVCFLFPSAFMMSHRRSVVFP